MNSELLIKEQAQLAELIEQLLRNFRKDSPARKTPEYLIKKREQLLELWNSFINNHNYLKTMIKEDHPYHSEGSFDKTQQLYTKALKAIEDCQAEQSKLAPTSPKIPTMVTSGAETEPQAAAPTAVPPIFTYTDTTATSHSANWSSTYPTAPLTLFDARRLNNFPKLPPIQIPKFSGNYKEWKSFIDIFTNVINNNPHLSNVEKMQYLLYHLEGDARKVISHLQLSDSNYCIAIELIKARFNNNRKIIMTYINTIMDVKKVEYRSQEDIIALFDTIRECLEALKSLDCKTDDWGPMIVCIAIRKLDPESLRLFEESLANPKEMPSTKELLQFLEKRHQVLDCIRSSKHLRTDIINNNRKKAFHTAIRRPCNLCSRDHNIYHCNEFKKITIAERIIYATQKRLCMNCLAHNKDERCKTNKSCFFCKKRHHTLLHRNNEESNHNRVAADDSTRTASEQNQNKQKAVALHSKAHIRNVLLPTALVKVKSAFGQTQLFRALIDPGSQVSLITEDAVQDLKLRKERIHTTILGVGDNKATKANNKVNFRIQLQTQKGIFFNVEALVLPKLSSVLPHSPLPKEDLVRFKNITLADPTYNTPGPIDLLLGADVYASIIQDGIKPGEPTAQNTTLGWILFGNVPDKIQKTNKVSTFISLVEIDQNLRQFWEMDSDTPSVDKPDDYCESHFRETHRRDKSGRYIVRLPFKESSYELGCSRTAAIARLLQIENRLAKNTSNMLEYQRFLSEYLALGHMTLAEPHKGDSSKVCYLPHHAVFKQDSTTTKLRVVFDASCKTDSQVSLNNLLHKGPKVQQDLRQILLRWRKHRYAITADIEKMFRQIKVAHKDRNFQRILWRQHPTEPIQEFILNTVTYGTAPATFLATRTLTQLANDEGSKLPIAKRILQNDFYIDDMLSGADTRAEAAELQKQIIELLRKGGFNLRKWTSNSEELLSNIPEDMKERGVLEIAPEDAIKTLGILWNPMLDEFQYKIYFKRDPNLTKRVLAAKIASIFDPLGFLSPITITAKLIMQSIWKENIDWDQLPSAKILHSWHKLEEEMQDLRMIKIPRWIKYRSNQEIQLHGFCDASEKAHAAAIYIRTVDSYGRVYTTLLTAKTKVTPLKQKITLPKLELCGALLLARLLKNTIKALEISSPKIFAWCDSEITICWISKNPNDLDTFMGNRVNEIQNLFDINIWRHVSSKENPADLATRGINPSLLPSCNLWWRGPLWLLQGSEAWPQQKFIIQAKRDTKKSVMTFETIVGMQETLTCSTYTKQVRVVAYCLRFLKNCKVPKVKRNLGYLTSEELNEARNCIIRLVQLEEFPQEVKSIKNKVPLKSTSKLLKLHPFLDSDGILRVGGRIQNSILSMEAKHQILLPQKHHITNLIIDHAHQQTLHGGIQQTLNYVRGTFWIIDGKRGVQRRNNKCIRCLRQRQKISEPLMGCLPTVRVTPSPPFSHSGIDYAGPFLTKSSRVRGRGASSMKSYIAVFVCMVTKAIHLELVIDLSTEAFLAAYKRFVARRGIPKLIQSDNGTNFVGARNKMQKDLFLAIKESAKHAAEVSANDGTEWKFIPPASPHFGGLWEAAVKSVKHHLKRTLGETLLTYEEFTTVLYQVEACLNSRPIGQHSSDPTDLEPLTPGHFLIGRPLLAPPEPDIADEKIHDRWKLLTKLYQNIWKRWAGEYLNLLQQRSKWTTEGKNPSIGELVLVKEDNLAPQKWPLGRIVELHPGEDGVVRIVSVQYRNVIKKRPLVKLCQLPLNNYQDENIQSEAATHMSLIKRQRRLKKADLPSEPELWSCPEHFDKLTITKHKNKRVHEKGGGLVPKKRKTKILPCTWASKLIYATLSILYWLTITFAQDYEIFHPSTGFYVENLGATRIKRGNLRLQVTWPIDQILEDRQNINNTWIQIKNICDKTRKLTEITRCHLLFKHLSTRKEKLLRDIEEILYTTDPRNRNKRGILGNILNSIFGVNDEIYTEIEFLQHNQQDLLFSSNQQMLLLNTKMNQTNFATVEKLKEFDARLAQVVDSVNEMNTWFSNTDHNRISIEVMSTYLSAEDYYDEVQEKYQNWLNAKHNHGHLLNFVSASDINTLIRNASTKISENLIILTTPQDRLDIEYNSNALKLHGYLNIVERNTYELLHITPIPKMNKPNIFSIMDSKFSTFAINFNLQTYFTLQEEEIKACPLIAKHEYLCAPRIIHDIEDSPSCAINQIYNRHPRSVCEMHQLELTGTIWKALMMKNTWLYITNQTTVTNIFCKGTRQELLLNNTGIIRLDENCYIKTKEIILKTSLEQTADVITSHMKEITLPTINMDSNKPPAILQPGLLLKPYEQLLQYSSSTEPEPVILRRVIIAHSISAATAGILIIIVIVTFRFRANIKRSLQFCCCRRRKEESEQEQEQNSYKQDSIQSHFNRVLDAACPQHVHT